MLLVFHNESYQDKTILVPDQFKEKCKVTTIDASELDRYMALFSLRDLLCKYKNSKSSIVFVTQPQYKREISFILDCLLYRNTGNI